MHDEFEYSTVGTQINVELLSCVLGFLVSGVIFNCLLLFLIGRFSRKEMGAYKQLLRTFASCDVLMSIAHGVTYPRPFVIDYSFAVTPRPIFVQPSQELIIGYCSLFTLPFYVMNINFLYRYWCIKATHYLSLFSNISFISLLIVLGAVTTALWAGLMTLVGNGFVSDEFTHQCSMLYYRTNHGAWFKLEFKIDSGQWNLRTIVLMLIFDSLAVGQACLAIVMATLTFYHIHSATVVSKSFKARQRKLLVALCSQTLVPVLCVYIPYLFLITSPILHLDMASLPDLFTVLISSFLTWDALVSIVLIRDNRQGILNCRPLKIVDDDSKDKSVMTL